jgi:hypothetical protein
VFERARMSASKKSRCKSLAVRLMHRQRILEFILFRNTRRLWSCPVLSSITLWPAHFAGQDTRAPRRDKPWLSREEAVGTTASQSCNARDNLRAGAVERRHQLAQDRCRIGTEGTDHIDELDHAQAALAALVLGNERLRLAEALGHLCLRETMTLAQAAQLCAQLDLARRAQGVAHNEAGFRTAASAHNPSGIIHFGYGRDRSSKQAVEAVGRDADQKREGCS